jgi:hypothetical protein
MQRLGRFNGTLNRQLPWQLQRVFTITLLNEDGAFVGYWLALELTIIPENPHNLDPVLKFVQVRIAPVSFALEAVIEGNVIICVHVIPEIATYSKTTECRNEQWCVNSHMDLATWNDVYNP